MKIKVNGTELFYETEGAESVENGKLLSQKPTLLLLHGGPGSDHSLFRPFFSELSDVAQIIYLDLRGQGNSDPDKIENWNFSVWVEDIKRLCESLSIDKPIIFGHSFGGMLAIELAIKYPNFMSKLILAHTVAQFNIERTIERFHKIGGEHAANAAKTFWTNSNFETLELFKQYASPVYCRNWPANIVEIYSRVKNKPEVSIHFWSGEGKQFNHLGKLESIPCETLVLGGDSDPFSGNEDTNEVASLFDKKHVHTEIFRNCGHFFWWDTPGEAMTLIKKFIAE